MITNNVSFGMALKQNNMMNALDALKTRELRVYNKYANKIHSFSNRRAVDVTFANTAAGEFGVSLAHKNNAAITSVPDIKKFPATKREMKGLYKFLKDEINRLHLLFKIDKKFSK